MPELPEVETVVRTLRPNLIGREITRVEVRHEDVIRYPGVEAFIDRLQGRTIAELDRRGKYICITLDDGQLLSAHLRMTGRLLYADPKQELLPHTHVIMMLSGGGQLRYADVRRFGGFWLLAKSEEDTVTGMQHLGVEPLSPEFNAEYLITRLGGRACPVKNGILDQSVIAGLGNIYADETLFAARVRPDRLCRSLTEAEWRSIAEAIPPILEASIANRGTTFSDFLDGTGREGDNVAFLKAYGRYGQPCKDCGAVMEKTRIGGRGTCFCPCCQK